MMELIKILLVNYPDRITESSPDPEIRAVAKFLKSRSFSPFCRSIHVRMVDAGSPNDVELEEQLMMGPRVDAERFGIHFVASPRHADVLLVSGPVTQNMRQGLIKSYDAMADPRVVVAAGDGACTGGPFSGDEVIPVDIKVPGNPPSPYALLLAILKSGSILKDKSEKKNYQEKKTNNNI
jgi:Ni,Fe-hydrogenase III small subunit